jgi:hypothetical protein
MNHRGVWLTAAVLAVIVLLAQVAGASTRNETASLATSVSAEVTGTAATVSLPEQASSLAREKSANGIATANESITDAIADRARTTEKAEATEKTETTEDEMNDMPANPPAKAPRDGTTGARPGWGCGDTNHKHSGHPGRHDATPPAGCVKP